MTSQEEIVTVPSKQGTIRKLIFSYDGNFLVIGNGYSDDELGTNNS
ncbi:MAG: hypothetical protein WBA93_17915 [Microcoleaceae cyanobacterium]